ncbi:Gypsy retrotransposon integrase-like protein 1 [Marasmius sp. AFHP31]|nr:Gypsy retrotransposon integrase-like protein 1 [Marasmius sp. AFHP31]
MTATRSLKEEEVKDLVTDADGKRFDVSSSLGDGGGDIGSRCSNCVAGNFECTYIEDPQRRGYSKNYVEALENRVKKMENFIRQFREDAPSGSISSFSLKDAPEAQREKVFDACIQLIASWDSTFPDTQENKEIWEEENQELALSNQVAKNSTNGRYFGRSSELMLIRSVIDYKTGHSSDILDFSPHTFGRPEFWVPAEWQQNLETSPSLAFTFPEDDLLHSLIDIYFKTTNVIYPLLHRPTFERDVAAGLHHQNTAFGVVLLLVCANGSRFSSDPRVLPKGVQSTLSSGWDWFSQVQSFRPAFSTAPALYDLQMCALSCMFMKGTSAPHSHWTLAGIGIRLAVDIGIHRRSVSGRWTVHDELLKRAFWCLLCLDFYSSATLGKPVSLHDEDFDQDLPMECDDEYWENPDPDLAFKQPSGTVSYVTHFNSFIKLMRILAMVLRVNYTSSKSELLTGFSGPQWDQRAVAMFDSSLNQWVDSLPSCLRWNPAQENDLLLNQSAHLYSHYYQLQIYVHRPYIAPSKQRARVPFPSLAICTNAARSCSHVVEVLRQRKGFALPWVGSPAFTSGIILLLNIWGGKRSGWSNDPDKEMAEVHKCMKCLRDCEGQWVGAGQTWDILYQLASVGELPVPVPTPESLNSPEYQGSQGSPTFEVKSSPGSATMCSTPPSRAASKPNGSTSTLGLTPSPRLSHPQHHAQSQRHTRQHSHSQPNANQQQLFSLPVRSDELGRLPVHGQLNYINGNNSHSYGSSRSSTSTLPSTPRTDANGGLGSQGYWFTPMCAAANGSPGSGNTDELMENIFATEAPVLMDLVGLSGGYPTWADVDLFGAPGFTGGHGGGGDGGINGHDHGGLLSPSHMAPSASDYTQHQPDNQQLRSPQPAPTNGWHTNQPLTGPSSYIALTVTFTSQNDTQDRKFKLLSLANTYGTVQNLWGDPSGLSFQVEYLDVDSAQRLKTAMDSRNYQSLRTQYSPPATQRTPTVSAVGRIWYGLSRNLRFRPEKPGQVTGKEVRNSFERIGLRVAKVWDRNDYIDIELYVLRDSLTVSTPINRVRKLSLTDLLRL